jgi:hypothetical protein
MTTNKTKTEEQQKSKARTKHRMWKTGLRIPMKVSSTVTRPVLWFSPTAWAKLLYFRDKTDNEIGGFGITEADDLLYVSDFVTVKQKVTTVSVSFEDEAIANFFDDQVDFGKKPEQFARIWIHCHPADSPETGLVQALNGRLKLLKRHVPYYESDHVLNIAYNILCNGDCLEDIERLRNDEVYLDALGAQRIPDPTTAGDLCRRYTKEDVETLMDIINETRLHVWRTQPDEFFEEAVKENPRKGFQKHELGQASRCF